MITKVTINKLFAAAVNVLRKDRVAALQNLTRRQDGHFETTDVLGRVVIVANHDDAGLVAKGISPFDPEIAVDKTPALKQQINFAGGIGLFSALQTEGHRDMRKPLSVLGAGGVSDDLPDLNDEAMLLAQKLSENPDIAPYPLVHKFASRITMQIFFGLDPDQYTGDVDAMDEGFTVAEHHIFNRIAKIEFDTSPLLLNGKNVALTRLNRFLEQQMDNPCVLGENETVLSRLIEAAGGPPSLADPNTRIQIKEQICHAMMASIQSTSSGIGWLLHDLAHNTEMQISLRQNIDLLLQDGEIDIKESRLPELGQIIDESLRRNDTVPLTLPRCPVGQSGPIMIGSQTSIHKDPRYFPDPDKLDPQRMSPEGRKLRPNDAFVPFSSGPHACPGQILYKTAAATVLAHIVHGYKISSQDTAYPKGEMGISTRPDPKAILSFAALVARPTIRLETQTADATRTPEPVIALVMAQPVCPYKK